MYDPHPADAIDDIDRDAFGEWPGERQRRAVEDALDFERYAPPREMELAPGDAEAYNPALDAYRETHRWSVEGWRPIDDTRPYRSAPAYLPTDEALELLADRPLLEIGAGSGYWAHVIEAAGGDVVPTDISPPEVEGEPPVTHKHVHEAEDGERHVHYETLWADVLQASHRCVADYPDRDVLLCHPPVDEWPVELLDRMHPKQDLVLVAEWYPGADAGPEFFRRLIDDREMEATFPVYDWASMHARGYVFSRV